MASTILALAVSLSDWLVYKNAKELLLSSTLSKMEGTLSLEIERITGEIDQAREQAEQLADAAIVQGFLFTLAPPKGNDNQATTNTKLVEIEGWRRYLEEQFTRLIQSKNYLQVRLINAENGMELVRVNRDREAFMPERVRGDELQNKSNRDYFKKGRSLKNGEIYISDITLNRENGQIVTPYQPTQRIVSPVYFDANKFSSGSNTEVLELAEQLRRFDQIRTLTSMRIAQSGNLAWHNRYSQTISNLNDFLSQMDQFTAVEDAVTLNELKLTHTDLQQSESLVIDYVRRGLLIDATQRIISKQYWQQKRHFKNTLEELISMLESRHQATSFRHTPKALIVINTDASTLLSTLNNTGSDKTLLVNSQGQYIHHPDKRRRWAFERNPDTQDVKIDEPWVWQALSETQKPKPSFDQHSELHITGKILYANDDPHRFLGLVITQPEEAVLKPIQAFKTQSIYVSILAILLSGLAIALFTRRQLKPISILTRQAKLITAGYDRSTLKIPNAKGEVKTMVDAFESLIEKLQHQTQEANENARAVSQLAETLEQRVKSRTAELAESMYKAEAASIAKSQFMATMSHEIRTPMNGVLGMAQLLDNSELTEQQRYYLRTINQSGQALLGIINDILDFSKIESGKLELEPIEFDLEHIAHDALHLLVATAEQKGLELIFNYDIHCPRHFKGDPGRIRQVLINLIGNAIKFTEEGYIQLNIRYDDSQHLPLSIEIIDSGIGISKEQQESLFEAFTQADASTTRRYGGTGLGLTISKRIITLMNGTIGVNSEAGQGTTFWFKLPLPPSQSPSQFTRANIDNVKVLIIDDNHINCVILEDLLQYWGLITVTATNRQQSIAALEHAIKIKDPFQLVLLDYMMPDCDGLTLGKEINDNYKLPQIMLTSATDENSPKALHKAGISICLSKPYSSKTLKNALEIALDKNNETLLLKPRSQYEVNNHRGCSTVDIKLNGKVLLVEDNLVNQEVAKGFLNQLGLEVDVAENGLVAIDRHKTSFYDLILMDCLMPIMDGFEATRKIRLQETGNRHTPIIALTANVMASDQQSCKEAGMDDFVGKPIEQDELVRKLSHWLGQEIEPSESPSHLTPKIEENTVEDKGLMVSEERFNKMRAQLKTHFQSIFSAYLMESDALIVGLKEAGEKGDIDTMIIAVHSLKSSSAALGAEQLSSLAESLESLYEKGNTQNWKADADNLSDIFQKTKQEMETLNEANLKN
ncbi:response regulator [Alkalimarinus alittae]|uniref:histidine kinase n=1 Tax=Alkalimarinus alittae TaxID=2961619 RepID=A0ABY6N3U9_9ALTE|nr:response regulator [Alkalimarinus alittae]UZE96667.1 response regulator [Alkalimarinus alittae]